MRARRGTLDRACLLRDADTRRAPLLLFATAATALACNSKALACNAPLLLPLQLPTAHTCTCAQAFVLVERATTADDAVPVLVWIGADYEGVADPDDEEVRAPRAA